MHDKLTNGGIAHPRRRRSSPFPYTTFGLESISPWGCRLVLGADIVMRFWLDVSNAGLCSA